MAIVRNVVAAFAAAACTPIVTALYINGSVIAPCDSPIYCHGDILKEVELARPFTDSKTFVDM
jgi:alpha,alpha-trehalase